MSELRPNGLQVGKPVLCVMPEHRMPEDITVGTEIDVLDTESKNGTQFVRVRFGNRPLTYWIPLACIGLSTDKAA